MNHTGNVVVENTFSGPMDLLLHLVRRDEIDLHDIPMAQLTKSYIEELDRMSMVDVDDAAEFLDMASRLVEMKGRLLLPPGEASPDGEDEADDIDPRAGLVAALLEYKRFKDAAALLADMGQEWEKRFPRHAPEFLFEPAGEEDEIVSASPYDLMEAFQNLLQRMLVSDAIAIENEEIPTEVRIEQIRQVIIERPSTWFSLLLSSRPNRDEMVGFFIALLELIRQRVVIARQAEDFSDILIERRSVQETTGSDEDALVECPLGMSAPRDLFSPLHPSARKKSARKTTSHSFPPLLSSKSDAPAVVRRYAPFPEACAYGVLGNAQDDDASALNEQASEPIPGIADKPSSPEEQPTQEVSDVAQNQAVTNMLVAGVTPPYELFPSLGKARRQTAATKQAIVFPPAVINTPRRTLPLRRRRPFPEANIGLASIDEDCQGGYETITDNSETAPQPEDITLPAPIPQEGESVMGLGNTIAPPCGLFPSFGRTKPKATTTKLVALFPPAAAVSTPQQKQHMRRHRPFPEATIGSSTNVGVCFCGSDAKVTSNPLPEPTFQPETITFPAPDLPEKENAQLTIDTATPPRGLFPSMQPAPKKSSTGQPKSAMFPPLASTSHRQAAPQRKPRPFP